MTGGGLTEAYNSEIRPIQEQSSLMTDSLSETCYPPNSQDKNDKHGKADLAAMSVEKSTPHHTFSQAADANKRTSSISKNYNTEILHTTTAKHATMGIKN